MIGKTLRLASICLGFMAGGLSSGGAADLVKIGVLNTSGDIAVHVANEKGYFRQEGIDIEFIVFDASAKMIPSLGVGDLDVGGGATLGGSAASSLAALGENPSLAELAAATPDDLVGEAAPAATDATYPLPDPITSPTLEL